VLGRLNSNTPKESPSVRISSAISGIVCLAASAASLAFIASSASAQTTLFDNTSNPKNNAIGVGDNQPAGFSITTDANTYHLTDVQIYGVSWGTTSSLTLSLYSDDASRPGSVITTLGTVSMAGFPIYPYQLMDYQVSGTVNLAANSRYWLMLDGATDNKFEIAMTNNFSGIGVAGQLEFYGNRLRTLQQAGAVFSAKVTATQYTAPVTTPEPGSMALLSGMVLVGGSVIRRRKARKA
jgi:hypothetical protein